MCMYICIEPQDEEEEASHELSLPGEASRRFDRTFICVNILQSDETIYICVYIYVHLYIYIYWSNQQYICTNVSPYIYT